MSHDSLLNTVSIVYVGYVLTVPVCSWARRGEAPAPRQGQTAPIGAEKYRLKMLRMLEREQAKRALFLEKLQH
jgi:hypothetical protein